MAKASRGLRSANNGLTSGKIDPEAWADKFHDQLYKGHLKALELGYKQAGGTHRLDDWQDKGGDWHTGLKSIARKYADEETQYLHGYVDAEGVEHRGFLNDLIQKDPRYYDADAESYIDGSLDSRTDLYVGKMRGTANEAFVEASPEDATFTWVLGPEENCPDCVEYAAIFDGVPASELFTVPGAGDSVCLGNCGCSIVRDDGTSSFGHHGDDPAPEG